MQLKTNVITDSWLAVYSVKTRSNGFTTIRKYFPAESREKALMVADEARNTIAAQLGIAARDVTVVSVMLEEKNVK